MAAVRKASSIDSNLGLTFNVQSTLFFFFLPSFFFINSLLWTIYPGKSAMRRWWGREREQEHFEKGGRKVWQKEQHTHTRDGMLCMKVQCPGAETTSSTCSEPQDRRTFISLRTSVLFSWNFFLKQTTKWVIFETRILTKTLKTRFFFLPFFLFCLKKKKSKGKENLQVAYFVFVVARFRVSYIWIRGANTNCQKVIGYRQRIISSCRVSKSGRRVVIQWKHKCVRLCESVIVLPSFLFRVCMC